MLNLGWRPGVALCLVLAGLGGCADKGRVVRSPLWRVSAAPPRVVHGAFVGDAPDRPTLRHQIAAFEAVAGKRIGIVHLFVPFAGGFPAAACDEIRAGGSVPLLSVAAAGANLDPLLRGDEDAVIRRFFADACRWGAPLLLRWGWEMNGDHPWSGKRNGGSGVGPGRFVAAWRHLRALGAVAANVRWVWCPDAWGLGPEQPWNDAGEYYPGAQAVDWLGSDGYGWQVSSHLHPLEVFDDPRLAANLLARLREVRKPIIVPEAAADRRDGRASAWVRGLWQDLGRVPGVRAICWFNRDQDGAKWALEPGSDLAATYREMMDLGHVWGPGDSP